MKLIAFLIFLLCSTIFFSCITTSGGNSSEDVKLFPEWIQINLEKQPLARDQYAMTYNSGNQLVYLFGGRNVDQHLTRLDDTWVYNGKEWLQLFPKDKPAPQYGSKMVFDAKRKRIILAGGAFTSPMPPNLETWEYYGDNWHKVTTENIPHNRLSAAMAYHSQHECTYLFGGVYSGENQVDYFNDFWRYDGNNWIKVNTQHVPPVRKRCEMVYDSTRNKLILFGGDNYPYYYNDTWEYDGEDWKLIETETSPPGRSRFGLVYNSKIS